MQFNSINFLFCFLPLFLAVYYLFPAAWRNALLVIGSLIFYFFAGSNKLLVMCLLVGTTLFTYLVGLGLRDKRKGLLIFGLAMLLALLTFLKLYDGGKYLPAGLSFYLFQQAAYLIDAYNRNLEPETSLIRYSTQIMMFPKVLMGPLMDTNDLLRQVRQPEYAISNFHTGLQEIILGLSLKVLIADRVGGLFAQAGTIGYESISTPFAWLALVSYAMRLYFDFWGYSVMARGIGHMLGFHLPVNFLDPYASRSVGEFWRRWHATLGTWFRKYLYFPLGGNRKGTFRTLFNLLVVWLFTGAWHGVGGNYLLWAMILFFFVINERLWLGKLLKAMGPVSHVYTVLVILLSWVPFAIGNWDSMVIFFQKLFGVGLPALSPTDYVVWLQDYQWLLLAGVICATPLPRMLWNKIKDQAWVDVLLFAAFWVSVYFICTSAQDPFMYFQY